MPRSRPSAPDAALAYRCDLWRSPFYGALEAGWQTFALIVAIRCFDAPESVKSFIAGAGPIGFLLTPLTLFAAARLRARPGPACAAVFITSAILLAGASLAQGLAVFAFCTVASQMAAVQQGPLMLQIYAENYPARERGNRITLPLVLTAVAAIAFAVAGGAVLDADIAHYRWIFLAMTLSAALCAAASVKMPGRPLSTRHVGNPWQNLGLVWKDKFFGYLLASWMLLGLGNLITLPIRFEYLANPDFGINADNATIAVVMIVIPAAARILSTRLWGRVFDKFHFVTTRNTLNLCFLLGIGLFFFTDNLVLIGVAMACQGLAMGGGKIFWSLWVTKIAETEKASSYMAVHMAMTGLRGSLAPFLGYWILSRTAPATVALAGLVLVALAIALFELVRKHPRLSP